MPKRSSQDTSEIDAFIEARIELAAGRRISFCSMWKAYLGWLLDRPDLPMSPDRFKALMARRMTIAPGRIDLYLDVRLIERAPDRSPRFPVSLDDVCHVEAPATDAIAAEPVMTDCDHHLADLRRATRKTGRDWSTWDAPAECADQRTVALR